MKLSPNLEFETVLEAKSRYQGENDFELKSIFWVNMMTSKWIYFQNVKVPTGVKNDVWLLKRPVSDIVILSTNTENHFNNCVRGGDSRMK